MMIRPLMTFTLQLYPLNGVLCQQDPGRRPQWPLNQPLTKKELFLLSLKAVVTAKVGLIDKNRPLQPSQQVATRLIAVLISVVASVASAELVVGAVLAEVTKVEIEAGKIIIVFQIQ